MSMNLSTFHSTHNYHHKRLGLRCLVKGFKSCSPLTPRAPGCICARGGLVVFLAMPLLASDPATGSA